MHNSLGYDLLTKYLSQEQTKKKRKRRRCSAQIKDCSTKYLYTIYLHYTIYILQKGGKFNLLLGVTWHIFSGASRAEGSGWFSNRTPYSRKYLRKLKNKLHVLLKTSRFFLVYRPLYKGENIFFFNICDVFLAEQRLLFGGHNKVVSFIQSKDYIDCCLSIQVVMSTFIYTKKWYIKSIDNLISPIFIHFFCNFSVSGISSTPPQFLSYYDKISY